MVAGDTAMIVALADSLFFSIDPGEARGKVLLFLVISFAPFLVIAPLIGPVIDNLAGGRRLVIQLVAVCRIVLSLLIARYVDSLMLFPLVFGALVLQKTYLVSKSALVPSVVRSKDELVEANSKLGVIAGIAGFVAVLPAGLLQKTIGSSATLVYSALLFGAGLFFASQLAADRVASTESESEQRLQLRVARLQLAAVAMTMLRCAVGFMFFHLAFWLRDQYDDSGTAFFGAAVAMSAIAIMTGNALAPRIRAHVSEENMLIGCLALSTAVGVTAALFGGIVSGIALGMAVNFSAAVGRLAFEAIVQRETPPATHGRAFAVFETRFQLGWAVAGLIPVIVPIPGQIGFLLAGVITAVALANYFAGVRSVSRRALSVRRAISSRASRTGRRAPAPRAPTATSRPAEPAPGVPPPPGARRRRTSPARSGPRRIGRRPTSRPPSS
jgi:hypothetical protein